MAAIDLTYCNKSLLLTKEKSPKIKELSDFNKIFSVHLLMNEICNVKLFHQKIYRF